MKKNNKKGFTIVELVIVIAVIGILAAVLIPTFGTIIEKANKSAALQEASASFKEAYAIAISDDGKITQDDFDASTGITVNDIKWVYDSSNVSYPIKYASGLDNGYKASISADGVISVSK